MNDNIQRNDCREDEHSDHSFLRPRTCVTTSNNLTCQQYSRYFFSISIQYSVLPLINAIMIVIKKLLFV